MSDHHYGEVAPTSRLRPYVECYWARSASSHGIERVVIPDNCVDLLIYLTGSDLGAARGAFLVGMMTKPLLVAGATERTIFGIRFRPAGLQAFLPLPLGKLRDSRLPAALVWPNITDLQDAILMAPTNAARCAVAEKFLLERFQPEEIDCRVEKAVLEFQHDSIQIEHIADRLQMTRQHLHRIFVDSVGLGPKAFSRVARFRRAMKLEQSGIHNAVSIALMVGYADQSHIIREFQQIGGRSPRAAKRRSMLQHGVQQ